MRPLRNLVTIFCLLAISAVEAVEAPRVAAAGGPASEAFRLQYPKKDHLTALQFYELRSSSAELDKAMGQCVLLDVLVKIQRKVPLVDIVIPTELAASGKPPRSAIQAHVVCATSQTEARKQDQRYRVEGIIAAEEYGAYTLYLMKLQRLL